MTALYTRYRSQRFDALVGQDAAVRTLRNAITGGRLAHAYLFTGIRGTGKTSTARILAKAVNCLGAVDGEPDNECVNCVAINDAAATDLIEIDAASNRGIDEIRDLREKANYMPSLLKRKVYIIDEAHQLTDPAFNALLKTLEEPPEHVLFILCTTESHKLPATIISRCQRFDFRRISEEEIGARLAWISAQEGLPARPDGVALLAAMAQGSMRDAITMLDQMGSSGVEAIDASTVRRQLGLVTQGEVAALLAAAARRDAATALRELDRIAEQGADMRQLTASLGETARRAVLLSIGAGEPAVLGIEDGAVAAMNDVVAAGGREFAARAFELAVGAGSEMRQTHDPRLLLELTLLKLATGGGAPAASEKPAADLPAPVATPTTTPAVRPAPVPVSVPAPVPVTGPGPVAVSAPVPAAATVPDVPAEVAGDLADVRGRWDALLDVLRDTPPAGTRVRALLRDAAPVQLDGDLLTLGFRFAMLSEKAQEPANRAELEKALGRVYGRNFRLAFQVTPDLPPQAGPPPGRPPSGGPPAPRPVGPIGAPPGSGPVEPPAAGSVPAGASSPASSAADPSAPPGETLTGERLVEAVGDILGAQITDIKSRPRPS